MYDDDDEDMEEDDEDDEEVRFPLAKDACSRVFLRQFS